MKVSSAFWIYSDIFHIFEPHIFVDLYSLTIMDSDGDQNLLKFSCLRWHASKRRL